MGDKDPSPFQEDLRKKIKLFFESKNVPLLGQQDVESPLELEFGMFPFGEEEIGRFQKCNLNLDRSKIDDTFQIWMLSRLDKRLKRLRYFS